jgi:hypothetical protein
VGRTLATDSAKAPQRADADSLIRVFQQRDTTNRDSARGDSAR